MVVLQQHHVEMIFGGQNVILNVPASTSTSGSTANVQCPTGTKAVVVVAENRAAIACVKL